MENNKIQLNVEVEYSIHVFDDKGKRVMDITNKGVILHDARFKVGICEMRAGSDGWNEEEIVYTSEGLHELMLKKE